MNRLDFIAIPAMALESIAGMSEALGPKFGWRGGGAYTPLPWAMIEAFLDIKRKLEPLAQSKVFGWRREFAVANL